MRRIKSVLLVSLFVMGITLGQDVDYHRNNVVFGVGPAIPVGSTTNFLTTAPLIHFGYGYRFNRLFQADAGLQVAFGAANNQNGEITDIGTILGGDHEFMIPLGGRIYVPQPFRRVEVSVGGGTAYLRYAETVSSGNSEFSVGCYSCTSRTGWGGYGMANASYYLDGNRNFHVGTTVQYISGSTDGAPVGNVPAFKTTDHWMNVFFEFGFSF